MTRAWAGNSAFVGRLGLLRAVDLPRAVCVGLVRAVVLPLAVFFARGTRSTVTFRRVANGNLARQPRLGDAQPRPRVKGGV